MQQRSSDLIETGRCGYMVWALTSSPPLNTDIFKITFYPEYAKAKKYPVCSTLQTYLGPYSWECDTLLS